MKDDSGRGRQRCPRPLSHSAHLFLSSFTNHNQRVSYDVLPAIQRFGRARVGGVGGSSNGSGAPDEHGTSHVCAEERGPAPVARVPPGDPQRIAARLAGCSGIASEDSPRAYSRRLDGALRHGAGEPCGARRDQAEHLAVARVSARTGTRTRTPLRERDFKSLASTRFAIPAAHTHEAKRYPAFLFEAGNGTRTRDPNLGKVVLYQLSYSRATRNISSVSHA
jgi:hypothetical protein